MYFPTEIQGKEKAYRNLGFWPVFAISSLVTARLVLLAAVLCRGSASLAMRLQSGSEVWCCSSDVFYWLEPGNRGQEKPLSWLVQCMGQAYTEIMVKCSSTILYKWKISWYNQGHDEAVSTRDKGFWWPVLSNRQNGSWRCTTPSHGSCQLWAQMCYRKSVEDFSSSMALLSIAVQNLSASTALRLSLLIKNQKREVRRKYVWFLVSSQHTLKMRSLEAVAAVSI